MTERSTPLAPTPLAPTSNRPTESLQRLQTRDLRWFKENADLQPLLEGKWLQLRKVLREFVALFL